MTDTLEVVEVLPAPTSSNKALVYVGCAVAGFLAARLVTTLINKRKETV
jgi:hypothetical protein